MKVRRIVANIETQDAAAARRMTGAAPLSVDLRSTAMSQRAGAGRGFQMFVAIAPGWRTFTAMPGSRRASSRVNNARASFVLA